MVLSYIKEHLQIKELKKNPLFNWQANLEIYVEIHKETQNSQNNLE